MRKLHAAMVPVALAFAAPAWAQSTGPAPGGPSNIPSVYQPRQEFDSATRPSILDEINKRTMEAQTNKAAKGNGAVAAAPEDILAGSTVNDSRGRLIGTVDSVGLTGAIVSTGAAKVEVPLDAFGKNRKGLLLGITKAEFDAAAAAAVAQTPAP